MEPTVKPNGRKYFLTKVGLAMTAAPLVGMFFLAGLGKFSPEASAALSAIVPPYYLAVGSLIVAFNGASAYVSGKTEPLNIQRAIAADGREVP